MTMIEWKSYIGKRILVNIETVKGVRIYSGIINDVVHMGKNTEGVEIYFLEMTDKFGERVGFSSTSIKLIEEEK